MRSTLRRRWRSALVVAFIVAIASGAVLSLVAGARRTAGTPNAYTASIGGDFNAQVEQDAGRPRQDEVAKLPGVASVKAVTFMFAGFPDLATTGANSASNTASNTLTFIGVQPLSSRLVSGRLANPTNPHEFVADKSFLATNHAHLGQSFRTVTWSRAQAQKGQGFQGTPAGPSFDAVLVGVYDSPDELDDAYSAAVFPSALLSQDVGIVATIMAVRWKSGVTAAQFRAQLDSLPDGHELIVDSGRVVSPQIRTAVDAQAQGTWLMAAVAALAALIAVGQLLARHSRLAQAERESLTAIGFTESQLVLTSGAQAAVPAIIGIAIGGAIAIAASNVFPVGFVRPLEPHPGVRVDGIALGVGALVSVIALLAWVAIASFTFGPEGRRRSRSTPNRTIAKSAPTPAATVGAQFALTSGDRSAVGTVVTLAVIVAGIVGTVAFAVSLDRLVTHRGRFGGNYSFALGDNSDLSAKDLRTGLANDPDIGSMMILTADSARDDTTSVQIVGVEQVQGGLTPSVLSGRLPTAADELALGRVTARQLHLHIGDRLDLRGATGAGTFHVVGLAVVPTIGGNDGVGIGAVLTSEGFGRLVSQPATSMAAVRLRPGAPANAATRIGDRVHTEAGVEDTPGAILNVARVRHIPFFLAALLGVLLLMAMFNAIVVSIRSRRQDLAILAAIGADRRWIGRAVHWQTTILAVLPLVIGIPLGLVAGAAVFRTFVDHIGAVPDPALPIGRVIGLAVALVVVANLVAIVSTRRARRFSTAELLRVD